jgi:hypothetical protein
MDSGSKWMGMRGIGREREREGGEKREREREREKERQRGEGERQREGSGGVPYEVSALGHMYLIIMDGQWFQVDGYE